MKILIAGYGFVGRAHYEVLKFKHDVVINDPALGYTNSYNDVDAVIVCVSTPPRADGSCHMDNVYEVIEAAPDVPILIKSTISVEGWDMLADAFPNKQMSFSPEFLRAATALEDFRNNNTILLGGGDTNFWAELFVTAMGKVNIDIAKPKELILAKYARNSFLALKVSYFNQINDLCTKLDVDYDKVRQYTTIDDRIGESHTTITDERGFGGHCFPKDTKAFTVTANQNKANLTILEQAINYNNEVRKDTT